MQSLGNFYSFDASISWFIKPQASPVGHEHSNKNRNSSWKIILVEKYITSDSVMDYLERKSMIRNVSNQWKVLTAFIGVLLGMYDGNWNASEVQLMHLWFVIEAYSFQ